MTAPRRIQMTRQRPWRADNPDAVIVARPSKWGNPYRPTRCDRRLHDDGLAEFARPHWHVSTDDEVLAARWATRAEALAWAVKVFRLRMTRLALLGLLDLHPITGRDLACWCPLTSPCHADVLLELANPKEQP